jgi:hypothetical protein
MKSYKAYITESYKTYDFRLRIAGELPSDLQAKIKQVLEAYQVDKMSALKRLPIQETPEFPNMGPVEVNIIDVCLCYPCNDIEVRTLVAERTGIDLACIKVTPANSPYEVALAGGERSGPNKEGESVLAQSDMVAEKVDADLVGNARIPTLIKELENARKYQYAEAAGGKVTDKSFQSQGTTNNLSIGSASPIGTHQNKVINPRKTGNGK